MRHLSYTIHLIPEPEGGYTIEVPALPGCVTWGRDLSHAYEMAAECIQGHLEALEKAGLPIPEEPPPQVPVEALIQVMHGSAA
ncbi:type II toxin-antitoxin system HicB family antitoxin [Candidatus Sumerlaeota bacterium]|nr:type II toxin-antitoxin system HicB family antitoxin [Candidatus Sumerlaeota bacterium]MBI3736041.1 type II toxin-antitoxin system HicB family antitoxin [Candidatus Sumerlaeota bacterium]